VNASTPDTVLFDGGDLRLEQIDALASRRAVSVLDDGAPFRRRIDRGAAFLDTLLKEEGVIYGVTTGYGDSCTVAIPEALTEALPERIFTFHGCGLGDHFDEPATRAILAARLASLCRGYSGVRYELLQRLHGLLQADLLPLIPEEGSVGASGDLTPLSYVAAVLAGQRSLRVEGRVRDTAQVFAERGVAPLALRPKEGLALMNGTAVMTGLACLAFARAAYLEQLATRITALASFALGGNPAHFDPDLFAVKPHPGPVRAARRLHQDLAAGPATGHDARLQDRYSLRCAPHVIGVLGDTLTQLRGFVETELNSANDNPIIDAENQRVLHGGHFYGGHIGQAMDSLKTATASVADLLDRQLAQLVDPKFNQGLPANLSAVEGPRACINHGFKAVQIGASAWTAEALKLTMPATSFSRSTECHNQDKVSMGTIAARDALRVLALTEQVTAATLLAVCQAAELRQARDGAALPEAPAETVAAVRRHSPPLIEDRPLEHELRGTLTRIRERHWSLYEPHF
jgi:histidine ammonia-lyase